MVYKCDRCGTKYSEEDGDIVCPNCLKDRRTKRRLQIEVDDMTEEEAKLFSENLQEDLESADWGVSLRNVKVKLKGDRE